MEMIPCGGFGIGNGLSVEKDEFGRPMLNANGSSGLDLFVVNLLDSEEAESGYTTDKTYEEIQNALDEDKVVILKQWNDVYAYRYLFVDNITYHAFTRFVMQDTYFGEFGGTLSIRNEGYLISPDDVVSEYYKGFSVQATAED